MTVFCRWEIVAVLDALGTDMDRACALSFEALTTPERLRILQRLENIARRRTPTTTANPEPTRSITPKSS